MGTILYIRYFVYIEKETHVIKDASVFCFLIKFSILRLTDEKD